MKQMIILHAKTLNIKFLTQLCSGKSQIGCSSSELQYTILKLEKQNLLGGYHVFIHKQSRNCIV